MAPAAGPQPTEYPRGARGGAATRPRTIRAQALLGFCSGHADDRLDMTPRVLDAAAVKRIAALKDFHLLAEQIRGAARATLRL